MKKTLLTSFALVIGAISSYSQTTFGSEQTIYGATGANPFVIASGNLDAGSDIDIVIGNYTAGTIEIYKNNGGGSFITPPQIISGMDNIGGLHLVDIDGVNGLDILATSAGLNKLVWFANDGTGDFSTAMEQQITGTFIGAGQVTTADINNDTNLDIVLVVYGNNYGGIDPTNTDRVVWLEGNGDGTFELEELIEASDSGPGAVSLADFDGDTDLDIVIGYTDTGNIEVYYNNFFGSGTVSWSKDTNQVDTGNNYLFVVAFADIDDNGSLDIIKSDNGNTSPGEIAWFNKEGDGSYTKTTIPNSINKPGVVIATDLNNDTFSDIIISNGSTGSNDDIIWFESSGAGTYLPEATISLSGDHKQTFGVTIADFDGDTDLDIASVNYQDAELSWFASGLILGLDDNILNKFIIYPNPSSDKLNFKGLMNENFKVSVFDILGKNVLNATLEKDKPLDVSKLNSGIYILKFNDYNTNFKFVKE